MKDNPIINKIKNCGYEDVYDSIECEDGANKLGKINVIFGRNGSGKSTLARILDDPKLRKNHFEFYKDKEDSILKVFSKDYIQNNLCYDDLDSTLDKKSGLHKNHKIEKILHISETQKNLSQKNKDLEEVKESKKQKAEELSKFQKEATQPIRTEIANEFINLRAGTSFESHVNKYRNEINGMSRQGDIDEYIKGEKITASHRKLQHIHLAKLSINKFMELDMSILQERLEKANEILNRDNKEILSDSIVNNNDFIPWILEGFRKHQEHGLQSECQFCNQEIKNSRWEQIASFVNQTNDKINQEIENAIIENKVDDIEDIRSELADIAQKLYPNFLSEYQPIEERMISDYKKYHSFLTKITEKLEEKKDRPDRMELEITQDDIPSIEISDKVGRIREIIKKNNHHTDNIDAKCKQARLNVVNAIFYKEDFLKKHDSLSKEMDDLEERAQKMQKQIDELNSKIKNEDKILKEINEVLNSIFRERKISFDLLDDGSGYTIKRRGKLAIKLSEGEKNAISLIYFLYSLRASDIDKKKLCVVLDDPISSFDSHMFYQMVDIIRQELKPKKRHDAIAQIIILTHSYPLLSYLSKSYDKANYRTIKYLFDDTSVKMHIENLPNGNINPINEYHVVFKNVYNLCTAGQNMSIGEKNIMSNSVRRLAEAFSLFCYPNKRNNVEHIRAIISAIPKSTFKHDLSFYAGPITDILNRVSHGNFPADTVEHIDFDGIDIVPIAKLIMLGIKNTFEEHYLEMLHCLHITPEDITISDKELEKLIDIFPDRIEKESNTTNASDRGTQIGVNGSNTSADSSSNGKDIHEQESSSKGNHSKSDVGKTKGNNKIVHYYQSLDLKSNKPNKDDHDDLFN